MREATPHKPRVEAMPELVCCEPATNGNVFTPAVLEHAVDADMDEPDK